MDKKNQLVVVGLSGGVDSAVAAALLLDQGYQVIGVSLDLWHAERVSSPEEKSIRSAQKVAEHLGIPWVQVDSRENFRELVVGYYLDSLKRGQTPNPCIVCNRIMKWRHLIATADGLGADWIATGHYARRHESQTIELHKASDINKDQSYFLSVLGQSELQRTIFPLGEYRKEDIRKIASERGIPAAHRKESQDLCFLGGVDQKAFIAEYAPDLLKGGEITHFDGRPLGMHDGLVNYTEGQRKGIRIAAEAPLYVLRKDFDRNELVVGEAGLLGRSHLTARDVNWISGMAPAQQFRATVKIRYRAAGQDAEIQLGQDGKLNVKLERVTRDITPGQALVMYQGDNCLGMGFIE
jgi:tRNA-specific 2-thiouridylase